MPKLPKRQHPLPPKPYPQPEPAPWKPLGLHQYPQPQEPPVSLRPLKPSKQSRNSKKQETKRLLEQQQRPQPNPVRLEDVVSKRLG